MEDQDLLEIGILNSGHRQRILQAIQLLPKVRDAFPGLPYERFPVTHSQTWNSICMGIQRFYMLLQPIRMVLGPTFIGHKRLTEASLGFNLTYKNAILETLQNSRTDSEYFYCVSPNSRTVTAEVKKDGIHVE